MKERLGMAPWILPPIGYILTLGAAGVTAKLALRTISWQQLILWVPIAYAVIAFFIVVVRRDGLPLGAGGGWAAATAVGVSSALALFFFALTRGEASKVVPASSAYPVVTLVGSALFLAESITLVRVVGTALVATGVVLLSR
jgi:transporter family protein